MRIRKGKIRKKRKDGRTKDRGLRKDKGEDKERIWGKNRERKRR